MLDLVFDMETQDPDDFLTLLLLLGHPRVRLKAVTVTPGSAHQVGVVRRALDWFGADLPVGAHNLDHPKPCVSSWHYRAYGQIPPSRHARPGGEVLAEHCDANTTLVTGAPLKNLGAAMDLPGFTLGRWVAQGGFAGEGVVPAERQLPKFAGRRTCPTFNLNGDPRSALRALDFPGIGERRFVSKNVCHGVVYDEAMHDALEPLKDGAPSLERIWDGMEAFLGKRRPVPRPTNEAITAAEVVLISAAGEKLGAFTRDAAIAQARAQGLDLVEVADEPRSFCRMMKPNEPLAVGGKKLHDPLAACCAIDPGIGTWAEVRLFREHGEWGSALAPGSGTWIITDYDHDRFFRVLTERAA